MANNVLKSWLGGFQTPEPLPETHARGFGYTCPKCGMTFRTKEARDRHIATFHGGSPAVPAPRPTPLEGWKERRWERWLGPRRAQRRAERRAEWLRRKQAPTQTLSNYPRLPQSTIPEPRIEYPAPGRPSKYKNPFAWRRKNNGWW